MPSTTLGRNTREVDTENAWCHAVDGIIDTLNPGEIVTIAGDIYHHPRVSDFAKKAFSDGVRRMLMHGLYVIVLQGNHDAGRTAEVLTPIMLVDGFGDRLYVVTKPERIVVDGRGEEFVSISCFPYVAGTDEEDVAYSLEPIADADVNILVMHAAVKGAADGDKLPFFYGGDGAALDIGREAERWDVIAVGDYHEFTLLSVRGKAFYSGSLERTSSNIWDEHQPKGWVLWDTNDDPVEMVRFHEVPTRPMSDWDLGDFDLPPGAGADDVNECLAKMYSNDRLTDTLVRFKVDAFPRSEREHIDWGLVRRVKSLCTHFNFDVRYAKGEIASLSARGDRRATLAEEAAEFFANESKAIYDLAMHHLDVEAENVLILNDSVCGPDAETYDGYENCATCQGGGEVECEDCDGLGDNGGDEPCRCGGDPVQCPDCEDGMVEVTHEKA